MNDATTEASRLSVIWGIALLIIGLIAGGWGGLLVLVGAIIALVASHV